MDGLFWPLLLLVVGIALLALELFIPSAGILGLLAGACFLAAIVIGFLEHPYIGSSTLMVVALILPAFLALFVHFWPQTPIGRRILLRHDPHEADAPPPYDDLEEHLRTLIGKRGRAKTKMLPSGAVEIDGHTYDAATMGLPLEPGQPVEVVGTSLARLVVRPVENDATPAPSASDDPLSQPIDQLGLSPFEDPLL